MADFSKPAGDSLRANFMTEIRELADSLAKMLDGTADSNQPTGAKRYNSSTKKFEYLSASSGWLGLDLSGMTGGAASSANSLYNETFANYVGASEAAVARAVVCRNSAAKVIGDVTSCSWAGNAGNADTLDGAHASATPGAGIIPISSAAGTLDWKRLYMKIQKENTQSGLVDSAETQVQYRTIWWNDGSCYSIVTDRYTPTTPGWYFFHASASITIDTPNVNDTVTLGIYGGGAFISYFTMNTNGKGTVMIQTSGIGYLNGAGHYAYVTAIADTNGSTWQLNATSPIPVFTAFRIA